jgi:uncharacterized membrane protein
VTIERDLPTRDTVPPHTVSARTHVTVAVLVGIVVGVVVAYLTRVRYGVLAGWDATALVLIGWVWSTIWRLDAERTAQIAVFEDPTRATADLLLIVAASASLVAVGLVLASAGKVSGTAELGRTGLGLASVVLSWGVVHTVFTLKYARLYYSGPDGGVNFHQRDRPAYSDFAYLAFTIGMTFQVSDTALESSAFRAVALRHALLSYLFGAVIVATTINLIVGLSG